MDNEQLLKRQKLFRAGGLILFVDVLGLVFMRILMRLLAANVFTGADPVSDEIWTNVIFDIGGQVCISLLLTFLVAKLYLKQDFKTYLNTSNVRKFNPLVIPIAVGIGFFAPAMSGLVNVFSNLIFSSMGLSYPSQETILPPQFNIGIFILYIFLTGVLPGVCEEMVNRGIALTALRGTFKEWQTIVIGGLVFGLFHQYIFQTYYTAVFGALLVFIALRTRSIIPCMIIHFTNNTLSVVSEFADFYHWSADVSLFGIIRKITDNNLLTIFFLIVGLGVLVLLVWLLVKVVRDGDKKKIARTVGIPADQTKYVNVEVLGGPLGDTVYYRPVFRDTVFYWGALIVSVSTTVFSVISSLI